MVGTDATAKQSGSDKDLRRALQIRVRESAPHIDVLARVFRTFEDLDERAGLAVPNVDVVRALVAGTCGNGADTRSASRPKRHFT